MKIYLDCCPDYYQKKFTRETFGYVLEKLSAPGQQLCVREGGLDTITTIYALWEQFIGMLGFENGTDSHKIEAEWLKFLHYGMVKGYLQDPELLKTAEKVRDLYFRKLPQAGTNLEIFREALASYCTQNRAHLEPSYWNKFLAETVNITLTKNHVFGFTYLAFAEQVRSEERIKYLGKAASRHFAINDPSYNTRLEQFFNRIKQLYSWRPSIEITRLRLAKRAYARHKPQDALNHLSEAKKTIQLPDYYRNIEFCCFAELEKWNEADTFLQNPPSLPVNKPEMRSDYAAALVKLGDSRLTHNKSKTVRFVSWFTSKPRKTNSSKALIYYKKAFEVAEGAARKAILEKMCVESNLDEIKDTGVNLEDFRKTSFDLACDFSKSKEWNESALHFLICIKCSSHDYLSLSTEGENLTHRFARTIAHLYNEKKIDESHLNLVEQAISQRKEMKIHVSGSKKKTYLDTKTLNEFLDPSKKSFRYDQASCLYLLKGIIMERLDSADTKGILRAYELATRLAPRHPWGASGYLAEDKDISIKDIKAYREYAIEFGAKDAIPMLEIY